MDFIFQLWGGSCYLANKILFALSEGKQGPSYRKTRSLGWAVYIFGVPPWVFILVQNENWIAASIEVGGLPAMCLGLYLSWYEHKKPPKQVYHLVTALTYASLLLGISNSLYVHNGLSSVSQMLEIGVMFGFLLSGYYIAKGNACGWLYFMLGNVNMAILMGMQGAFVLMAQQLISLCFVFYGYSKSKSHRRQAMY